MKSVDHLTVRVSLSVFFQLYVQYAMCNISWWKTVVCVCSGCCPEHVRRGHVWTGACRSWRAGGGDHPIGGWHGNHSGLRGNLYPIVTVILLLFMGHCFVTVSYYNFLDFDSLMEHCECWMQVHPNIGLHCRTLRNGSSEWYDGWGIYRVYE